MPAAPERDESPRANRSNTFGRTSGAMPGPLSVTVSTTPPPSGAASRVVTVVPGGVRVRPSAKQPAVDLPGAEGVQRELA